ncbi:MAG: hypothetical protein OXF24_09325 [Hyphomicrobiales bacterium]|nr:hypothetical protein [Hyphomicrobiales bacterium]MCY4053120.1 hypothetical protein [Hyphomicrobiales bacterium]
MGKIAPLALLLLLVACEDPLKERFLALSEKFNPAGGEVTLAIMSCTFDSALSEMGREQLKSYVVLMEAREQEALDVDEEVRLVLQVRNILQACAAEILTRQLQEQ